LDALIFNRCEKQQLQRAVSRDFLKEKVDLEMIIILNNSAARKNRAIPE